MKKFLLFLLTLSTSLNLQADELAELSGKLKTLDSNLVKLKGTLESVVTQKPVGGDRLPSLTKGRPQVPSEKRKRPTRVPLKKRLEAIESRKAELLKEKEEARKKAQELFKQQDEDSKMILALVDDLDNITEKKESIGENTINHSARLGWALAVCAADQSLNDSLKKILEKKNLIEQNQLDSALGFALLAINKKAFELLKNAGASLSDEVFINSDIAKFKGKKNKRFRGAIATHMKERDSLLVKKKLYLMEQKDTGLTQKV